MTPRTTGRTAGAALLLYIGAGLTVTAIAGRVTRGDTTAARLASIAEHAVTLRWVIALLFAEVLCAFVLAVTFYALTRAADEELALLAMICRIAEGLVGSLPIIRYVGLMSLAGDPASNAPVAAVLLRAGGWTFALGSLFFSIGSAIFAALFVRNRAIPPWLAWTGLAGSLLMIVILPLQAFGILTGPIVWLPWLPLFVFEVGLGVWLLVRFTGDVRGSGVGSRVA